MYVELLVTNLANQVQCVRQTEETTQNNSFTSFLIRCFNDFKDEVNNSCIYDVLHDISYQLIQHMKITLRLKIKSFGNLC